MQTKNFVFGDPTGRLSADRIEVRISSLLGSKDELLKAVADGLRFPDYFGMNWDAFEECLRDLSWLREGQVVLLHDSLPMEDDIGSQATYLAILSDAAEKWMANERHELLVVFPETLKDYVRSLLAVQ